MMQIQKLFQMNFAHQTAGHRNTIAFLTPPWPCAANETPYPQFLKIPGVNACHLWVRICLRDLAESQSERIALYAGIPCGWSVFIIDHSWCGYIRGLHLILCFFWNRCLARVDLQHHDQSSCGIVEQVLSHSRSAPFPGQMLWNT